MSNPHHQDNTPSYQMKQVPGYGYPQEYPHENRHASPQKWKHGMCGCFNDCGVCCTGYWCPCILHGKTKHRMRNPTMEKYSCCNASCMAYVVLATWLPPFYFILGMRQRAEIRQRYNLAGGGCGDYCRSLCCSFCSVVQEENEVRARAHVQTTSHGYQAPAGMAYPQ